MSRSRVGYEPSPYDNWIEMVFGIPAIKHPLRDFLPAYYKEDSGGKARGRSTSRMEEAPAPVRQTQDAQEVSEESKVGSVAAALRSSEESTGGRKMQVTWYKLWANTYEAMLESMARMLEDFRSHGASIVSTSISQAGDGWFGAIFYEPKE